MDRIKYADFVLGFHGVDNMTFFMGYILNAWNSLVFI